MIHDNDEQWKGILKFDLKIHNIYFNKKGKYFIKLRINGSRGDLSKIKLIINDLKKSIYEHEYTSEPFFQHDPEVPCQLDDTQFRFEMPEEFSEGEVHLIFETYQCGENPLIEPFKCGEGSFLIFPCATPLQSLPSTSADKEICYQFSTQLPVNQLLGEEQVYVNIGQIHITVLLEMEEKQGSNVLEGSNVLIPNSGLDYPIAKMILPESVEGYDNIRNSDTPAACRLEKNSHPTYSEKNSLPDSLDSQQGLLASDSNSTHTRLSEKIVSESKHASPEKLTSVDAKNLTENNESSFKKAWTTSIDQPVVQTSKDSLGNWDHQVNSSGHGGTEKVEDSAVYNTGKRNDRKFLKQPEMVRKPSISSKITIKDPPLCSTSQKPSASHLCGSCLDDNGNYEIVVQVHSACDLPSNALGRPPQPYVTGKTTADEQTLSGSQCATHATLHTTYSPLWEEILVIKVPKEHIQNQELILNIVDEPSKTLLTKFKLPLQPIHPFYPYHLQLEQIVTDVKAKLYVTLLVKASEIILPSLHSEIYGLEIILRHFTSSLAHNCNEPLVAVVRVVSDFNQYFQRYLQSKPRQACIKTKKVKYPSSGLITDLASMLDADQYNVAHITLTGEPSEQPKWEQMLFFHGDQQSLFSRSSALIIEYFIASQIVSFGHWQPSSPVGYSVYNLDHILLKTLRQNNATMGVRIENIPIKDSSLKTKSGEPMSVNIILRLVTKKRPDPMMSPTHYPVLPVIDLAAFDPTSFLPDVSQDGGIKNFPEISSAAPLSPINQQKYEVQRSNPAPEARKTIDEVNSNAIGIIERQTKEIGKHRYAMKKMADDIIQLKSESTRLQAANNRLRLELQHRNETNYLSSLPSHFENTTHAELVQRIVIVKGSLDEQSAINRELRLEIQSLHNQMIKKNEKEKEFYKLQDAHKNQQILLQKMQERLRRTKTLEDTCKKQEKVIMRLEEVLANSKTKDKDRKDEEDRRKATPEDIAEENRRLRVELLNYERTKKAADDMDRLHVHDKLHRAEARVKALEKELLENTRKWARDKAELQLKLSETQVSQNYEQWSSFNHEPLTLFDMTPPDSRSFHTNSKRSSPKLSPLTKK